jgi:hypothetical protein
MGIDTEAVLAKVRAIEEAEREARAARTRIEGKYLAAAAVDEGGKGGVFFDELRTDVESVLAMDALAVNRKNELAEYLNGAPKRKRTSRGAKHSAATRAGLARKNASGPELAPAGKEA